MYYVKNIIKGEIKMKEKIKGLLIGIISGVLIVTTVFAASGVIQKNLEYNNIKITLNGQEIQPKDANGNYVEPFTIDGTTYLPVRAISNALGLNVDWDGNTNTVLLSTTGSNSGQVVYEKGGIKITYTGFTQGDYSKKFKFLVENNSSRAITVQARDESINGFMVSGIMSDDVQPGKKANAELTYYNSTLEENGISIVENLEFSFHIFDEETWDTIDDSPVIKVTP